MVFKDMAAQVPALPPAKILVYAREFRLNGSRMAGPSGTWRLQLRNIGEDEHDLAVRRADGVTIATTPIVFPSATGTIRVRLKPGRYTLYCRVAGHEALGMSAPLIVRKPKIRTTAP